MLSQLYTCTPVGRHVVIIISWNFSVFGEESDPTCERKTFTAWQNGDSDQHRHFLPSSNTSSSPSSANRCLHTVKAMPMLFWRLNYYFFCPGKKYVYHCIFTFHFSFVSSPSHFYISVLSVYISICSSLHIYIQFFCFICSPLYFNISVISSSKNLYEHETANIWVRFPGRKKHTHNNQKRKLISENV